MYVSGIPLQLHFAKNAKRFSKKMRRDFHLYFLLPVSRESIVFRSNFRNGDFDGFTRFEVF